VFSVLILTLNEERNLPLCIASLSGCDDIVILDSGSTDRTLEIACEKNIRVFTRKFDNFANQRNWAQKSIAFRHEWVFHLDADERMTGELSKECLFYAAHSETGVDGYLVAPRMYWRGSWIPRSTDFPAYQARFVRAPHFEFVQAGHGQREHPRMVMRRLNFNYEHEMCSDGIENWILKHKKYALQEAIRYCEERSSGDHSLRHVFSFDPLKRRRALKHYSYDIPFRPLARFLYQYLLRGGILDGMAGLVYCRLIARYEGFASQELTKIRKDYKERDKV
jgi:glycosyltransferase involved in cell wall biosynthesis